MNDDVAEPHYATGRLPQRVHDRPIPWVPGEMLVGVHTDVPAGTEPASIVGAIRGVVTKILGDVQIAAPPPDPPLLIPTLQGQQHLVFAPITLGSPEPRLMRTAIASLNSREGQAQFASVGLTPVAATPNWFGAAQHCSGGSPASQPVPVDPHGGQIRYAPQVPQLDFADQAEGSAWAKTGSGPDQLHVAVLDTVPTPEDLAWAGHKFTANTHLQQVLARLVLTGTGPHAAEMDAALQRAMAPLEQQGGFRPIEPAESYDMRDHGLFVASVVHATAPWARIRLMRVLNNFGVGSLHSLTIALVTLVQSKRAEEPLVINLSLGVLPPLEQLLDIWFGFAIEGLPGCPENPDLQFLPGGKSLSRADLQRLLAQKDPSVSGTRDLLHEPLHQLMAALQANNCLVIAAGGNDSVYRGVQRRPRWGPRLPALYDEVLGVAADTVRPGTPARYSNRGEIPAASVRDAVATLGGDLAADGLSPSGGVLGVYSAEQFPAFLPPAGPALNETGWAEWAGTSFAAPIMAGIAANFWATHPDPAQPTLHKINALVHQRPNVSDLGVPGVPTRLTWLP